MFKSILYSCSALVAVCAVAAPALAQDTTGVEEVIVTANKRAENVQDVPKSVQVVGSQDLQKNNIVTLTDIKRIVPSISGTSSGGTPSMRGVATGAGTLGANSKVGVVLDDVPQASRSYAISNILDIERVEVLPGPQGTLSGRNATGGLINIVTAGPTDVFKSEARATATSDREYIANLQISGPISDTLSFSASPFYRYFRGLRKDAAVDKWDASKLYGIRAKLRWKPTDDLTATGTFFTQYQDFNLGTLSIASTVLSYIDPAAFLTIDTRTPKRTYAQLCPGVTVGPNNISSCSDIPGRQFDQTWSGTLRVDYDLGGPTLSSITGYLNNKRPQRLAFQVVSPVTSNEFAFRQDWDGLDHVTDRSRTVSQEFRLTSPAGDDRRLNYVAGVFYQKIDNSKIEDRRYLPDVAERYFHTKSYAAFGHVGYKLFDRLTAEGGLRYESDEVSYLWHYELIPALPTRVINGQTVTSPQIQPEETSTNSHKADFWNYDAALKYKVMEDVQAYVSYSKAQQGPLFDPENNIDSRGGRKLQPLKPEDVKNVEIGLKSQFFERRLTLNVSAFDAKYHNYQQQNLVIDPSNPNSPPAIRLASVGAVSTKGVEIQAMAAPTPHLRLNGSAAFLNTEILNFDYANCYNGQTEALGCSTLVVPGETTARRVQRSLAGRDLPSAPHFRGVLGAAYTFDKALPGADVTPSFTYSYQTKTNTDILGSPSNNLKAVGRLNADVALQFEKVTTTFFVNNLFKGKAETFGYGASGFNVNNVIGSVQARNLDRDNNRYYGVRVNARF